MKTNLVEKFEKIAEHWHPYIIGELNDNYVKLAKLKGEYSLILPTISHKVRILTLFTQETFGYCSETE